MLLKALLWHHFDGSIIMGHRSCVELPQDFLSGLHQHPPERPMLWDAYEIQTGLIPSAWISHLFLWFEILNEMYWHLWTDSIPPSATSQEFTLLSGKQLCHTQIFAGQWPKTATSSAVPPRTHTIPHDSPGRKVSVDIVSTAPVNLRLLLCEKRLGQSGDVEGLEKGLSGLPPSLRTRVQSLVPTWKEERTDSCSCAHRTRMCTCTGRGV